MITDWRLAEALAIQKLHGTNAAAWTAGRLAALAMSGDADGVTRFTAITTKLEELLASAGRPC